MSNWSPWATGTVLMEISWARVGGPTEADLPALTRLLREPSEAGREAAARAIGPLGAAAKEAVPRLIELLGDKSAGVRVEL